MKQTAHEFMLAYERATNSHDADLVLSLVDEQAVYLFSDESVHVGKKAIEKVVGDEAEVDAHKKMYL